VATASVDASLTRGFRVSGSARCYCGKPLVQTPGKRARRFCGEACRSAARRDPGGSKRAAADAVSAGQTKSGRLGTESTEFREPKTATPDGPRGRAREGSPLSQEAAGKSGGKTPAELAAEAAKKAKAWKTRRYQGRRTLWRITGQPACKGCGRDLMDPESGALYVQTAEGASVVLGMMHCARIWFCPVCSATIRQKRAEEITRAVVEWIKRGGTAYLVTLTPRHDYRDDLADLMDAIQGSRGGTEAEIKAARAERDAARDAVTAARDARKAAAKAASAAAPKGSKRAAAAAARDAAAPAEAAAARRLADARTELAGTQRQAGAYQRLITGGVWAGDDRETSENGQIGIRGRIGYVGMIRATELTVGTTNLWHPHIHAIVLVGGSLASDLEGVRVLGDTFEVDPQDLEAWENHWRATWTNHLQKTNPKYRPSDQCGIPDCKCDGKGHGVDFKRLKTARDAKQLGEYIAKTQDGKSPALELARGDMKTGRQGNMTPFEVLYRIGDLMGGTAPDDPEVPGQGSLEWCLGVWHGYERAMPGRRAIEWTRGLRTLLGIEGDDTEDGDKDLLLEADGDAEFRGGAAVTEDGVTALVRRGLDLEAVQAAEGKDANTDPDAVADRLRAVLDIAQAPAGSVRPLTGAEVSEAWSAIRDRTAQRREDARKRRARDAERDADQRP